MRKVVFSYSRDWNDVIEEIAEYDYDVTDKEIDEDFERWVWDMIGDNFSWHDIEEDDE